MLISSLLMQDYADTLLSFFIDGDDPALIFPTIVRGYVTCTRVSEKCAYFVQSLLRVGRIKKVATLLKTFVDKN